MFTTDPRNCDKCGRKVALDNDCSIFDSFRTGNPMVLFFFGSRHLLPVVEDGLVVCLGSPSRAQYLQGQPRDSRAEYSYDAAEEPQSREAYDRMVANAIRVLAPMN